MTADAKAWKLAAFLALSRCGWIVVDGCGRGDGGAEGIRTPGLLIANEALSQLSYSPVPQGADNAQRPRRSQATQGSCTGQSLEAAVASDKRGDMCRPQSRKNFNTEDKGEDVEATE